MRPGPTWCSTCGCRGSGRRSSSRSDGFTRFEEDPLPGLLEALDGDPSVDAALSDDALVRAMLDAESALARALSRLGLVPPGAGDVVTAVLSDLPVDAMDLGRRSVAAGNPVVPLVQLASAAVPADAAVALHRGATSQDVLDTALMLCAQRALGVVGEHLGRAADAAAALAQAHRDTLALARTLGQPALPTTFGLRCAGWLRALDGARAHAEAVRDALPAQLGGAAGTLAAYGDQGLDVLTRFAQEVGLGDPRQPWHTDRRPVQQVAAAAAQVVVAAGKVATDVLLMSQAEVGEVREGAPGGSSAMPHKQNPVRSVLVVSAARRAPGLLATVHAAGLHEYERAWGSWHAEWVPLRDLLRLTGGAAARVASLLSDLHVDVDAMRRNLDAAVPGVMSEAYAGARIDGLGRSGAQEAARDALRRATGDDDEARRRATAELGEPVTYLGSAGAVVDRVLAARRQR